MQTTEVKKNIKVVVAIIIRKRKVLISSRKKPKIYYNYWEFPGGKVKKNETNFDALSREIREEISINLLKSSTTFYYRYNFKYRSLNLDLNFFKCEKWLGNILPQENQKIKWVSIKRLGRSHILPSNTKIINKISEE